MSDLSHIQTPRTDAAAKNLLGRAVGDIVKGSVARQLERELAVCRAALCRIDCWPNEEIPEGNPGRAFCEISLGDIRKVREALKLSSTK